MADNEVWRPLNIMLSMNGSRINSKLVFKYPFENTTPRKQPLSAYQQLTSSTYHLNLPSSSKSENLRPEIQNEIDQLNSFSDDTLGNILSPGNTKICGHKLDVKINGLRFVGFPLLLEEEKSKLHQIKTHLLSTITDTELKFLQESSAKNNQPENTTILSFNIAFALKAVTEYSTVEKYQDLCMQLGIAMRVREKCQQYLSKEILLMLNTHDELQTEMDDTVQDNAYRVIVQKSKLAKYLSKIYTDICDTGVISSIVNDSIFINFCIPQIVHNKNIRLTSKQIKVTAIEKKLTCIRPYHAILIYDRNDLITALPDDYVPSITRFLTVYKATKSLQRISTDSDLPLKHVYKIASQLVYWDKACVIFPLCDTNLYVLSPSAQLHVQSELSSIFYKRFLFPLCEVLQQFSLPLKFGDLTIPNTTYFGQDDIRNQVMFWLLQHRYLMQIYTYLKFLPSEIKDDKLTRFASKNIIKNLPIEMAKIIDSLPLSHKAALHQIPATHNLQDFKSFINLLKYFDGKHHIEDIMYNENLTRSEVRKILDRFKPVLLTCVHEDPTTVTDFG